MEEYLDRAERLLWDVVQSRDIPPLDVLHRLRDLAEVLDGLKLYDECRLAGNCALDFAEALGQRSLEFRREQGATIALIAELSVYRPRACTLFIQAVSISEEVVAYNPSHSNKYGLLFMLYKANHWVSDPLRAQWLERAVQLMTRELPSSTVHPAFRSGIYRDYENARCRLREYAYATEAAKVGFGRQLEWTSDTGRTYNDGGMRREMSEWPCGIPDAHRTHDDVGMERQMSQWTWR